MVAEGKEAMVAEVKKTLNCGCVIIIHEEGMTHIPCEECVKKFELSEVVWKKRR